MEGSSSASFGLGASEEERVDDFDEGEEGDLRVEDFERSRERLEVRGGLD